MKIFVWLIGAGLCQVEKDENFTVHKKAVQKINHIKKNVPVMFDLFFGPGANPVKRKAAQRFISDWSTRVSKNHERLIKLWHKCGTASLDESFDIKSESLPKFDHGDPMKAITQLTNAYKQWIAAQIQTSCKSQIAEEHHMNRIKKWAKIWKYKYCLLVNPEEKSCEKHQVNPRNER